MSITLSPNAAAEIHRLLQDRKLDARQMYLRIHVQKQGHQDRHALGLDPNKQPGELEHESRGIRLVYSPQDRAALEDLTIDFRDGSQGRGFVFEAAPGTIPGADGGEQAQTHEPPGEASVRQALREVIDPEVGVNIVDLGLVYGIAITDRGVQVRMTMTTPACPLGDHIQREVVRQVRQACPGASRIDVALVWEPRWTPAMMTDEARQTLGWAHRA